MSNPDVVIGLPEQASTRKLSEILDAGAKGLQKMLMPLCKYSVYLGAILLLCMAVLTVIDILSRFFFHPLSGVIDYETFMLAIIGFMSLAYTMIKNGHVSVDLFTPKFPPLLRAVLGSISSIFAMILFGIISWQNVIRAILAIKIGEASNLTGIPTYPFYLIATLGGAILILVLFSNFLRHQAEILKINSKPLAWILIIFMIAIGVMASPLLLKALSIKLGYTALGILMIVFMLLLMFMGFPIAFAMGFIGLLGTRFLAGSDVALGVIRMAAYDSATNYFFTVVPLFILMGLLCFKAGIGEKLYKAGHKWFGHLPGGLAIGTIFGCAGFASICGDSMATAATLGSVALPEMKKYDYDDGMATGSLAAGGTLGILIPPSIGFMVYGLITEQSVGKLFIAGIIPGIILTCLFSLAVYTRCKLNPTLGPRGPQTALLEKISSLKDIWSVIILFALVLGGLYSGIFTATEAGAVGVIGALIVGALMRGFSWKGLMEAFLDSIQLTAMITAILIGVSILGYFITLTEIPLNLSNFLATLPISRYWVYSFILMLYVILGMLFNIIPMIMLTLPIIFPTVMALGFDPIWFGVVMVIMMEMGQITPPVGINVFVIYGVTGGKVPMGKIFKGILPFILVEVVMIIILTLWPNIALILPNAMDVLPSIGE